MDPRFGEYITQQYSLLKGILSNLQPCDLRNAKLVCRDWSNAVDSVLDKNPKVFSCVLDENGEISNIPNAVLPDLILYHSIVYSDTKQKKCEKCEQAYLVCPCKVSSPESNYLAVLTNWGKSQDLVAKDSYWKTPLVLMLSSSQHVKISTFRVDPETDLFDQPLTDEVVNRCIGGEEPIKAIIIISFLVTKSKNETVWINSLLNRINERQGLTFAVGGGNTGGIAYKKGFTPKDGQFKKRGVVFITFRGDSVSAHSDVFTWVTQETSSEFKRKIEDIPAGGTRIAFIAQNHKQYLKESGYISKYFSKVPKCGFKSWLEYGIRSSSREPEENGDGKRARLTFDHTYTTSLLLLTFKKV